MKGAVIVLMFFGLLVAKVKSQSFYVATVPNVIRFEHDEEMVISIFEDKSVHFKIWLEYQGNKFSKNAVTVADEKNPATVKFKVTESDIIKHDQDKPRILALVVESKFGMDKRDVILSYRTGYIILQTDQPIYTPMQNVQVRALALDENFNIAPLTWQVVMDIMNPSNNRTIRFQPKHSKNGFYKNSFKLPPFPEIGIWTAKTSYGGQFETEARLRFEVKEYVLPTFGVNIVVNKPYLLIDSTNISVNVTARYVYGKSVQGKAGLTVYLINTANGTDKYLAETKRKQLINGEAQFNIMPTFNTSGVREGSRLKFIATVIESATGKEEAAYHDGTVIAKFPYKFDFSRSKTTYRPGWEYMLKVDILHPNGAPASDTNVTIKVLTGNTEEVEPRHTQANKKGQVIETFSTQNNGRLLSFKVETIMENYSSIHTVEPYIGNNQLQVEQYVTGGTMWMRATSNANGDHYTGMIFMVLTRGKIVQTNFVTIANSKRERILEQLQEIVSPSGRLLVFYIDKRTKQLVADSDKFILEAKCRGNEIKIQPLKTTVKPESISTITITGEPHTNVGTNVIDKALLLLNDNILKKSKMFEELESHDIGCGMGGGLNVEDVFRNTGLTVFTNANVSKSSLTRSSETCQLNTRRKRNTDGCYLDANELCCNKGYEYAMDVFTEATKQDNIDAYAVCYAKARILITERKNLPTVCIMAFFYSCQNELESLIAGMTHILSKTFGDDSNFQDDLKRLNDYRVTVKTRSDFRESWLFEEDKLNERGKLEKSIIYPASITTWMIQAIGITPHKGMCIAEPVEVEAYRDFFIQLDLPYKAVRLEQFDVKATIFNYATNGEAKSVNVYLTGMKELCSSNEPGSPSNRIQLMLKPNSLETVRFPMIPLTSGKFLITVTAFVTNLGIPEVDAIQKTLSVVNEGIDETITIKVCLDPNNQMEDCENTPNKVLYGSSIEGVQSLLVDLTLPSDSIPGTGSATAYVQCNIMDDIVTSLITGVETLLRLPGGCGEQTMFTLCRTVYGMTYLKQTKQITEQSEVNGNLFIRSGVTREITTFRNPDGSYSRYSRYSPNGSNPSESSTWLTAFVAKVFCQAKHISEDSVTDDNLKPTIKWLIDNINANGEFVERNIVNDIGLMGQVRVGDQTLTAFVLISLQECDVRTEEANTTMSKALQYLERIPDDRLLSNPYLLAITTYALAMSNSKKKYKLKQLLNDTRNTQGRMIYWGNPEGSPASANSVETTAYALMAFMLYDDFKTSAYIVRWLTAQKSSEGFFRSTQDTVVALQALSMYSIRKYTVDVDLQISIPEQSSISITLQQPQKVIERLPVEKGENNIIVKVQGKGSGRMTIDLHYNRKYKPDEVCHFTISTVKTGNVTKWMVPALAKERNCNVCGQCKDPIGNATVYIFDVKKSTAGPMLDSTLERRRISANTTATPKEICVQFEVGPKTVGHGSGMSIVNFGLETGMKVEKNDLDKLMEANSNIAQYEMPENEKGFIIFYLNQINSSKTSFIFRLIDTGAVTGYLQPASVTVYDYYNPNKRCIKFYGTGTNIGNSLGADECDESQKICQCVRSECATPVENVIIGMVNSKKIPALILYQYACNPEKANYAVIATVTNRTRDNSTDQNIVRAVVNQLIHEGIQKLNVNDEIIFTWKVNCAFPNLEIDKKYMFIAKDGYKTKTANNSEFRYPLMGTAIVIKLNNENLIINTVMKNFKTFMEKGCNE